MRHLRRDSRLLALLVTLVLIIGFAMPAVAEDLRWQSTITYTVDAESGVLHVSSEMTFTNLKADTVSGNLITSYFFDSVQFYVPDTAESITANSGSNSLNVSLEQGEGSDLEDVLLATVAFGRRLFYQQSVTVRLDFDIPGEDPRGDTSFRINPAYISFGAYGWGDPGRVTVKVVVPSSFDVTLDRPHSDLTSEGDEDTYTFADIEDPDDFFVYVQARDDDRLTRDAVDLSEYDVVVRSWPNDLMWNEDVIAAVEAGLPELQALVGLDWRPIDTLQIVESQQVTLAGYGGWYLEEDETIEIGEWVDPHLVLHELSHTWFNGQIFEGRWINEGMADEFAARAVENAGLDSELYPRLEGPPSQYRGAVPLSDWTVPDIGDEDFERYEQYGYDASFWVMQEIADEIGHPALASVLDAAVNNEIAYLGASEPETVGPEDDWRRFLDLLQERGGSVDAEQLFTEFVTDLDLASRAAARESYESLQASGDDWEAPLYVREPLGFWDFKTAESRIDQASQILELRDEIEAISETVSADPPTSLEATYESSTTDLDAAGSLADEQLEAIELVAGAKEAVDADPTFIEVIGLIGEDLDRELGEAVTAFESDSLDSSTDESREVLAIVAAAAVQGRNRLLIGVGIIVLLVVVVWFVMRRRRSKSTLEGPFPGVA